MFFNSIDFIFFFIIILTALVIIKHRKFQHLLILLSSYFFIYYSSNYLIILLVYSTILDFYVAKEIWKTQNITKKKILLTLSLVGNLGLLGFFKYADFAIFQINLLGNNFNLSQIEFLNLALPIGISFYTFQTIGYVVDVYRGKLKPTESLREFAIFVSFFPQLVAGPIIKAREFLPQLQEKFQKYETGIRLRQIIIKNSNLKIGITLMSLGFFKKMFFADNIAPLVDIIFTNPIGQESFTIILGAITFGIQIYCDFSGYSDIAIGAALILGFKIPINFNKPYFANSPSDFWKRWHISLSSWLREYLYIPLGGNRKSNVRTYFNLTAVMFLGGLWHGASWNFVIWGLLHGSYLSIHKIISNKFPTIANNLFFKTKSGKIISILLTQYFIFLAWIPFRVKDFDAIIYSMQKYIVLDFQVTETITLLSVHTYTIIIIMIFLVLHYISYKKGNLLEIVSNLKLRYWCLFIFTVIMSILLTYGGNSEDFIYFRF